MGYPCWADFDRHLGRHRRRVQDHFNHFFAAPAGDGSAPTDVPLDRLWRGALAGAAAHAALAAAGFPDPAEALRAIARLRESAACRHLTAQGRERLDYLKPLLLAAVAQGERPNVTLTRVLAMQEKIARRTAYLTLLVV